MKNAITTKILLLVSALWLSGCGQSPKSSAHQEPVKGMRMGTDYQKPGSPVRLQHDYDGSTELSTAEIITLKFIPSYSLENVTVEVKSSSDSLVLNAQSYSGPADANTAIEIPATINADQEGKFYLNMFITSEDNGQKSSRSFALAVVVGDPPLEKTSAPVEVNGESVRILNAEETRN